MNTNKINWNQEKIDNIIVRYSNGESMESIARYYAISPSSITRLLVRNGAKTNRGNRRYNLNEAYFEKIDTPNKAYFLGFLYADGNVSSLRGNRMSITLQGRDKHILESFANELEFNGKLILISLSQQSTHVQGRKIITRQNHIRLRVNSKKIVGDLINLGCVPRKSLILKFPTENQVSKHLIRHFIRGYFDGDGCVSLTKKYISVQFSGTMDMLSGIQKTLNTYANMPIRAISKLNSIFSLNYGTSLYSQKFFNYVYNDAELFLIRKKDKFSLLSQFPPAFKTSQYKGISWRECDGMWVANKSINKKQYCIGRYKDEETAKLKYDEFCIKNNLQID